MPKSIGQDTTESVALSPQCVAVLSCLESARDLLARRLVANHHAISDPDLNYITTSSLLQIVFLSVGQEYGFVEPGTLRALAECDGIVKRMGRACSDAGLSSEIFFEQGPGGSPMLLSLSDECLREIIPTLDTPEIPEFVSRLSAEDLAAVLDHLLGTRMQTAEGYRVVRTGKSALLYTGTVDVPPQTIVEYIVRNTINGAAGSNPVNDLSSGRILDPACGTGLFLLGAYRYLIRKKTRLLDRPKEVEAVLLDIAGRSLFGTDIDPDSVSATRFILLSAFIDEMRQAGLSVSPGHIRDVCSGLAKRIQCGNALIDPDYFSGKPAFPFNADERRRVNPFDWQKAYPGVLAEGGFDAVIGAPPPYRPFAVKAREEYFQTHFDAYAASAGLYGYFIEKGLGLLRHGGTLTFLVPGTFLRSQHFRPLRRLLLTRQIELLASTGRTRNLPEGTATMYILSLRNQPPEHPFIVSPSGDISREREGIPDGRHDFTIDQRLLGDGGWKLDDTRTTDILEKIQITGTPLDDYIMGEIESGTHRVKNNPLVVDMAIKDQLTGNARRCRHFFVPLLRPADIRRYVPGQTERFLVAARDNRDFRKCRALVMYWEKKLQDLQIKPGLDDLKENTEPEKIRQKIIFSPYQQSPAFCFDRDGGFAITTTLLAIPRNDPFLAGILNSTLARFVLTRICPYTDRGYHISPAAIGKFPLYVPDFDKLPDKTRHDKMVSLVTHILELNRYLPQAKTDQERRLVQQEIDATDVQIDALVYELYGLTAEEITVVESSTTEKPPS